MPEKTFEDVYGTAFIGSPIADRVARLGPPLSLGETESGTQIYEYAYPRYHAEKCTIYWEVREDKIVAMTHRGPECKIYN